MNADDNLDNTVDGYVETLDLPIREIVIRLREIVTGSSADMKESIKWNVPTYSINSTLCSIMAHKKHVNLQIFRGAHIDDANLLSGSGKDMRHIKFSNEVDIDVAQLKRILAQAIEQDG